MSKIYQNPITMGDSDDDETGAVSSYYGKVARADSYDGTVGTGGYLRDLIFEHNKMTPEQRAAIRAQQKKLADAFRVVQTEHTCQICLELLAPDAMCSVDGCHAHFFHQFCVVEMKKCPVCGDSEPNKDGKPHRAALNAAFDLLRLCTCRFCGDAIADPLRFAISHDCPRVPCLCFEVCGGTGKKHRETCLPLKALYHYARRDSLPAEPLPFPLPANALVEQLDDYGRRTPPAAARPAQDAPNYTPTSPSYDPTSPSYAPTTPPKRKRTQNAPESRKRHGGKKDNDDDDDDDDDYVITLSDA